MKVGRWVLEIRRAPKPPTFREGTYACASEKCGYWWTYSKAKGFTRGGRTYTWEELREMYADCAARLIYFPTTVPR